MSARKILQYILVLLCVGFTMWIPRSMSLPHNVIYQSVAVDLSARYNHSEGNATMLSPNSTNSTFAYVYLLGGVDPDSPTTYRGFLYNVFASTFILRRDGSNADVVIYMQWKYEDKNNTLSKSELRVLEEMNIILDIHSATKTNEYFFERLMMEKFQLWKMTQYERIIYFDADVMPLCNMDYIFHMSKGPNAVIKPNMIFPGLRVPANGGIFLLEPSLKDYKRLQSLLVARFNQSFDEVQGWGRVIQPNETWSNYDGTTQGNRWDFYAAHVDQGLLWHWMRYEKGTFSAPYPYPDGKDFKNGLNRSHAVVQNWSDGQIESTIEFNFTQYSCLPRHWKHQNLKFIKRPWFRTSMYQYPFHSDVIHYMGHFKPWQKPAPDKDKLVDREYARDGFAYWFFALGQVDQMHDLGIDWSIFGDKMKIQNRKPRTKNVT